MDILLIYATYSSGTLVASQIIQEELQKHGHTVNIVNAGEVTPEELQKYKIVLMGSPSWMINNKDGQPHHLYFELMKKLAGMKFKETQFAIFGLGDSAYARLCHAVDELESFVQDLEGKKLLDSLRVDSFYFDRPNNDDKIRHWASQIHHHLQLQSA